MVASAWPLTKKNLYVCVCLHANFLQYNIIHTQVHKIKIKHTCQNSRMSIMKCTIYFLVGFIDDF
jgi:hypothetical protein